MSVRRYATSCVPWANTAGGYVRYSSYERLLTQNAKQAAEITKLRQAMDAAGNNLDLLISYEQNMSPTERMSYMVAARNIIDAALAAREVG